MKFDKEKIGKKIGDLATKIKNNSMYLSKKTKEMVSKSKDKVVTIMDVNEDGIIDINDIIILVLRTPVIRINERVFKRCS